jgi:hypothetical protein
MPARLPTALGGRAGLSRRRDISADVLRPPTIAGQDQCLQLRALPIWYSPPQSIHPSGPEGELARPSVDRVAGPGGQRWWSGSLVREDGNVRAVTEHSAIEWRAGHGKEARAAYR